jgi:hypothetical protein
MDTTKMKYLQIIGIHKKFLNYIFKGLAFETLGPWCKETIDFINVIGDRLIAESGDSKSKKFLFERISLAIQRGTLQAFGALFQIPHYYRKFSHCKLKMLFYVKF